MVTNREVKKALDVKLTNALTNIVIKSTIAGRSNLSNALKKIDELLGERIDNYMNTKQVSGVSIIGIMGIPDEDQDFIDQIDDSLKTTPISKTTKKSQSKRSVLDLSLGAKDMIKLLSNNITFKNLKWKEGVKGPAVGESWFFKLLNGVVIYKETGCW